MDAYERYKSLGNLLIESCRLIAYALLGLPVPVRIPIPTSDADVETISAVCAALMRTHDELLGVQPIPDTAKDLLGGMIVDWLNAEEMMALIQDAGPASYRMEGVERAVARITRAAEKYRDALNG